MLNLQCFGVFISFLINVVQRKETQTGMEEQESSISLATSYLYVIGQVASCLQVTLPDL